MQQSRAANPYLTTQVTSSSPLELVVLLYDGAVRSVKAARDAVARRDLHGRREPLSRALSIVAELQGSLDHERGGDVARELDRLYAWCAERLLDGAMHQTVQPFDQVLRVLETLRGAWQQIAAPPPAAPVAERGAP